LDYNIAQSTNKATGVSASRLKQTLQEGKTDFRQDPAFLTPKKRRKLPERNEYNLTTPRNLWYKEKFLGIERVHGTCGK
jgi:hypothetical protein